MTVNRLLQEGLSKFYETWGVSWYSFAYVKFSSNPLIH